MTLTPVQTLVTILAIAAGTILTRALPFLLFPAGKETPRFVKYLGRTLPFATIGLLVVYCLREVQVLTFPYGLPELLGVAAVAGLHLWRHNTLLSIGGGTLIYMLLVQFVF